MLGEIGAGRGRTFDDIESVRGWLSRHGFINDPDPADAPPFLIFLAKISGTRYHDASAQDARRRIVAFFDKHLKK